MPASNVDAIAAKYNAPAEAEAAADSPSAPPAGVSTAASASVDVEAPGNGSPASPEAPNTEPKLDHAELQAKLAHDRKLRSAKELKKKTKAELDAAAKDRAEAADLLAKAKSIGKDQKWLDHIRSLGRDPREVWEEMRQEALKAGTPDAKIDVLTKQLEEERAERLKLEKKLEDDKKAIEEERARAEQEREKADEDRRFVGDIKRAIAEPQFASLLEEYEPEQLEDMAQGFRREPWRLKLHAQKLGVRLTNPDEGFNMLDIFNVMHAAQTAHRERMQRRTQSAASQTSVGAPPQAPAATPTVNGTAERKAAPPTTIGNALASERAAEVEALSKMTKEQKRAYLEKKYPQAV